MALTNAAEHIATLIGYKKEYFHQIFPSHPSSAFFI